MATVGRADNQTTVGRADNQTTAGRAGDRGAVTVEAALALCSLVVVLALVLAAVSAVAAQLRCVDAAREAARLTARGDHDRAEELARRVAPRGAVVAVIVRGDEVTARVSANPVAGLLPGIEVKAEAVAVLEPVAPEPGNVQ
ncbi:MAG: TadE family type IV pilus minor pilin [Pseudonocardiaceae bacterium]